MTPSSREKPAKILWWLLVPCLLGGWSLWRGQDINWDTLNYHRHNGHALLTGRVFEDLLPAGFQTYFHPGLDVLFTWLEEHLGAQGLGFVHGTWQGLALPMIWCLAYQTLGKSGTPAPGQRAAALCAWAGVLSACFWAEVGTTFGDATTAIGLLAAMLCAWRATESQRTRWWWLAGACAGLALGFKLTNLPGVTGLGAAIVVLSWRYRHWRAVGAYSLAVVLAFAVVSGPWMYALWKHFGNPLFPQFAKIFPHPWLPAVSTMDTRFLPTHWAEFLTWPAMVTLQPKRISEEAFLQILWLPAYVLGLCLLARTVRRAWQNRLSRPPAERQGMASWSDGEILVGITLAVGFLAWMAVFSIYRYLVFFELLLPLALLMMWRRWSDSGRSYGWWKRLAFASMGVALFGGSANWGHAGWREPAAQSNLSRDAVAADATVALFEGGWSWLTPLFPEGVHFVGVSFPLQTTPVYAAEVRRRLDTATEAYVLVGLRSNWRRDVVARANHLLGHAGMLSTTLTCNGLDSLVQQGIHAGLERCGEATCETQCRLTDLPSDEAFNQRVNAATLQRAVDALAQHGQRLDSRACRAQQAWLGDKSYDFLLCRLERSDS